MSSQGLIEAVRPSRARQEIVRRSVESFLECVASKRFESRRSRRVATPKVRVGCAAFENEPLGQSGWNRMPPNRAGRRDRTPTDWSSGIRVGRIDPSCQLPKHALPRRLGVGVLLVCDCLHSNRIQSGGKHQIRIEKQVTVLPIWLAHPAASNPQDRPGVRHRGYMNLQGSTRCLQRHGSTRDRLGDRQR